jgi:hypothetical protein
MTMMMMMMMMMTATTLNPSVDHPLKPADLTYS